jgi:hypothetical protein
MIMSTQKPPRTLITREVQFYLLKVIWSFVKINEELLIFRHIGASPLKVLFALQC